jgi:hypothetical protein
MVVSNYKIVDKKKYIQQRTNSNQLRKDRLRHRQENMGRFIEETQIQWVLNKYMNLERN